jgi:hypothetical protein
MAGFLVFYLYKQGNIRIFIKLFSLRNGQLPYGSYRPKIINNKLFCLTNKSGISWLYPEVPERQVLRQKNPPHLPPLNPEKRRNAEAKPRLCQKANQLHLQVNPGEVNEK